MTDETETAETVEGGGAIATLSADPPAVVESGDAPEPITWWNRFGSPLVIPALVTIGIVVYVLSISRIFLAADPPLNVIFATLITLAILGGATWLANSSMKGSSMALVAAGGLVAVGLLGSASIGGAEHGEDEVVQLPQPPVATFAIEAGDLFFKVPSEPVPVGTIELDVLNVGTHNVTFEPNPNVVVAEGLEVVSMPGAGEYNGQVQLSASGDYVFYCSIPGHRGAGMEATISADESIPAEAPPEGAPEAATP